MSKYAALHQFLTSQRHETIPITFAEVERITGVQLPASAYKHRPWWSNNPHNSVMTKVWLDAGFESEQVDMTARRLVFRRVRKVEQDGPADPARGRAGKEQNRHPLFGLMKGVMRIRPGTNLTNPADPRWGAD
jgi:hypothetical protein